MTVATMFQGFLDNIKIDNDEQISNRYREVTKALNASFRETESSTSNCLQVGSYGRWTAIRGISDLDMLYIMPSSKWDFYNKPNGQSQLLKDTKEALLARYPRTTIFVDRLVVCVQYKNFHIEVQPVFEQQDQSYKYPDTYNGGSWRITKPREEINEMQTMNDVKNRNLRRLCKMARAWKNKCGVAVGGLLIDTLAYNFLKSTNYYDDKSYYYYDFLSRDFFKYLADQPNKDHYQALGSNQDVKVKDNFQKHAKAAYENCLKAIDNSDNKKTNYYWRKVYGSNFPDALVSSNEAYLSIADLRYRHTEEYVEDKFKIDVRYKLRVECEITKEGGYVGFLRGFKKLNKKIKYGRKLRFFIKNNETPKNQEGQSFLVYWKVLNRGQEAMRRDCIRGQIYAGSNEIEERSSFNGEHIVECYIVQNNVVVARDRIYVPIDEVGGDE